VYLPYSPSLETPAVSVAAVLSAETAAPGVGAVLDQVIYPPLDYPSQ